MNLLKTLIIAKYTFWEIFKSRILYVTAAIGAAIILITFVATEFTYGVPEKIALDFGLGTLSFSSLGIAIFMGATLLTKEIDSRTVYMVISRPVPRWAFIAGKILGLVTILTINILILSIVTLTCTSLMGGEINQTIIMAILFNFLEALLLLFLVVFLSLFANTILTTTFSIILLMLGHAVKETQTFAYVLKRDYLKQILEVYHLVLPGFYKLNLKDFAVYRMTVDPYYLWNSFLYGTFYSLFLFLLTLFIFNKKNLD